MSLLQSSFLFFEKVFRMKYAWWILNYLKHHLFNIYPSRLLHDIFIPCPELARCRSISTRDTCNKVDITHPFPAINDCYYTSHYVNHRLL